MKQIQKTDIIIKQYENRNIVEFLRIVRTEDVKPLSYKAGCTICKYSIKDCPPYANSIMVKNYKSGLEGYKPMGCLVWEAKRQEHQDNQNCQTHQTHQTHQTCPKVKHGIKSNKSRNRLSIVGILKKFFTG